MENQLSYLVNRQQEFTVEKVQLLDRLTHSIRQNAPDSKQAHEIWRQLKDDHYFWYHSQKVLKYSQIDQTKVFMLVILEQAIKQKWYALPENERSVIKQYIISLVLDFGAVENLNRSLHNILSKANSTLVQIVKYQWNTTWTSFISDICSASVKNMSICENNFYILKMLSEEIFDYSKNQMTQHQIIQLKTQMNQDFMTVFDLCKLILENVHQAKQSLVKACLETLNAFLSWIPMYYIIYTDLIDKLILLLNSDYLRNHSLSCLVEIASLKLEDNEEMRHKFIFMLKNVTIQLNKLIPLSNSKEDVSKMLNRVKNKTYNIFEILARGISLFYSEFFKIQYQWLQKIVNGNQEYIQICQYGFRYLIMMMKMDEDQIFKIVVEFFHFYIGMYLERQKNPLSNQTTFMDKRANLESIYPQIFQDVMKTVSLKMTKPEEVLIIIDQDGFPIRQEIQNTQNSSMYEIMKQLAIYLVQYNWNDMKTFILSQIEKQQNQTYFSFDALNSLSWIVGSLCGAILNKQQRSFFINTLRTLLQLCELKKGKDNKAVIASCIMYVVGQYPTFLRNNWNFLRTVVKKLFQFMKEQFPGVMEMACNAFLKIAKSTSDQFVIIQLNDHQPYIRQIIRKIPQETKKLNNDTLQLVFYESIGHLISAQPQSEVQLQLMKQTLGIHLFQFYKIIEMAKNNQNILKQQQVQRKLILFLKLNEMLATGVGQQYIMLLQLLSDLLNKLYLFYSEEINKAVLQNGIKILNYMTIRIMRTIKKQIIKINSKLLQKCSSLNFQQENYMLNKFIFPLGELLKDFQNCIPQTKQQEFVALFTLVLEKLNQVLDAQFISKLVQVIFSSSLPLITTDFNSFPEIRTNFFAFIKALIKFNFQTLYSLDENHFSKILECVIWSFRHQLSTYSDLGLDLMQQILNNVNKNVHIANLFYPKYHLRILTDILEVLTDGFHKSGLKLQSKLFYLLVHVLGTNLIADKINPEQQDGQSNSNFLYNFLVQKLTIAFPNINKSTTVQKVGNWFQEKDEKSFKLQIADYLVLINRYSPQQLQEATVIN